MSNADDRKPSLAEVLSRLGPLEEDFPNIEDPPVEPEEIPPYGSQPLIEKDTELVDGSGNVFRDFGDPEADLKQAKAVLAARIIAVLDDRGLAVRKAASLTGFAAADFSRIRNADLGRFTLDRLMKMLAALDAGARVTVKVDLSRLAPAAASSSG